MENKINIAELLKDCPKGTKLYSPLCGECEFRGVYRRNREICIEIIVNKEIIFCNKYGCYFYGINGEVIIFPSKENRDWSKFQRPFKDGDIVATTTGSWIGITEGGKIDTFIPTYCVIKSNDEFEAYLDRKDKWQFSRLATEKEKEKLFNAIKANGYNWNEETKTLEKVLNKFDITTLIPFESKVLVRDCTYGMWKPVFWGKDLECSTYRYLTSSGCYKQCIPYEGNEHLLGINNDCDEFYKTW